MSYRKDLVTGISLAIFSIMYFYFSLEIKVFKGSGATPLDSRFIPRFWGSCLFILSVMLIIRAYKEKKMELKEESQKVKNSFSLKKIFYNNYEVILTFVAIAVYILLLKDLGFIIVSTAYIFAQILILTTPKKKNYIAASITAIVFAVVLNYIFVNFLNVLLPKGILGF